MLDTNKCFKKNSSSNFSPNSTPRLPSRHPTRNRKLKPRPGPPSRSRSSKPWPVKNRPLRKIAPRQSFEISSFPSWSTGSKRTSSAGSTLPSASAAARPWKIMASVRRRRKNWAMALPELSCEFSYLNNIKIIKFQEQMALKRCLNQKSGFYLWLVVSRLKLHELELVDWCQVFLRERQILGRFSSCLWFSHRLLETFEFLSWFLKPSVISRRSLYLH